MYICECMFAYVYACMCICVFECLCIYTMIFLSRGVHPDSRHNRQDAPEAVLAPSAAAVPASPPEVLYLHAGEGAAAASLLSVMRECEE